MEGIWGAVILKFIVSSIDPEIFQHFNPLLLQQAYRNPHIRSHEVCVIFFGVGVVGDLDFLFLSLRETQGVPPCEYSIPKRPFPMENKLRIRLPLFFEDADTQ